MDEKSKEAKNELKPCPFCGNQVVYGCISDEVGEVIWILCQGCNMETRRYYDKKGLIEMWNKRAKVIFDNLPKLLKLLAREDKLSDYLEIDEKVLYEGMDRWVLCDMCPKKQECDLEENSDCEKYQELAKAIMVMQMEGLIKPKGE